MRFDPHSDIETEVTYYFVPEDTPYLPFKTAFRSWNNVPEFLKGSDHLGEVAGAVRTYHDGSAPFPTTNGPLPCGTERQWYDGVPMPPVPPTPRNAFGGPACCPLPESPFVFNTCDAWPGGVMDQYTLIVAGGVAEWAGFNGTYLLRFGSLEPGVFGCQWGSDVNMPHPPPSGPCFWILGESWRQFPIPPSLLPAQIGTSFEAWFDFTDWSPLQRYVAPRVYQFGPFVGPPSSVVLLPGSPGILIGMCANIAGPTQSVYYAEVPTYSAGRGEQGLLPMWYHLAQTDVCVWTGNARLVNRQGTLFPGTVPLRLTVLPGGTVRLTLGDGPTATWQSLPGWNGTATPLALLLTGTAVPPFAAPPLVRLHWPI